MRVNKRPDILDDGKALRVILRRRGHVLWLRTLEKRKQTFSKVTKCFYDLFLFSGERKEKACAFSMTVMFRTFDCFCVFAVHFNRLQKVITTVAFHIFLLSKQL